MDAVEIDWVNSDHWALSHTVINFHFQIYFFNQDVRRVNNTFNTFRNYLILQQILKLYIQSSNSKKMQYIFKIFQTQKTLKIPHPQTAITHSSKCLGQTLSNYGSRSSSRIDKTKQNRSAKRLHAGTIAKDIRRLLAIYYTEISSGFFINLNKYLMEESRKWKKPVEQHLNKISFIEQSMQRLNYSEIELEVLKQWGESPILDQLLVLWHQSLHQQQIQKTLEGFLEEYHRFCVFLGQVAYLYFGSFFNTLENIRNIDIIERLTQRTSHFILTQSKQWGKLYENFIQPLIASQIPSSNPHLSKFSLKNLEISQLAINPESQHQSLIKTTKQIKKFVTQHNLLHKLHLLTQIRQSLLEQIKTRQTSLIKSGQIRSFKVLDKDDFISCLVFCIVEGRIHVDQVGTSLREIELLFGEQLERVLSGFGCGPYFADLKAVYEYLMNWSQENEQAKED